MSNAQAALIPEEKWIRFWRIVFREIDRIEAEEQKEKTEAVLSKQVFKDPSL